MQRFNNGLSAVKRDVGVGNLVNSFSQGSQSFTYGRVVEVITSLDHPKIKQLGGSQALYGLFYQPLFVDAQDEFKEDVSWRFAYCGLGNIKQVPIKGEIVKLECKVAALTSETDFGSDGDVNKLYWTEIVPVWNHPHLNNYPDTIAEKGPVDLGKNFKENENIKPLQLNEGDVVIEGRHGQTLRFGGTTSKVSPIATKESNGKPYTILRNGQSSTSSGTSLEDINKDDSSLYLTSDHKVPIKEANRKFRGARTVPPLAETYKGKQAVLNSDRVVVNAREDNLILAAKKHASINADSTSIDGEKYIGLDATKIYLGTSAQKEREPVLKGTTTGQLLIDLGNAMNSWCASLAAALTGGAAIDPPLAAGGTATATFQAQLQSILGKGRVDMTKSTKVYTE